MTLAVLHLFEAVTSFFCPEVYFGVGTYGTADDKQRGLGACYRLKAGREEHTQLLHGGERAISSKVIQSACTVVVYNWRYTRCSYSSYTMLLDFILIYCSFS